MAHNDDFRTHDTWSTVGLDERWAQLGLADMLQELRGIREELRQLQNQIKEAKQ